MKKTGKLAILVFVILAAGISGTAALAQNTEIKADTLKTKQKEEVTTEAGKNQNQNQSQQGNSSGQQAGNQNNTKGTAVKQVKGARPDMSKAKGARPNITRPSGSGIPKGAGKPGGVGRVGGR